MNKLKSICLTALLCGGASVTGFAQDGITLTRENAAVTENFNSMWDGSNATLVMPDGWRVDRNLSAPRQVNAWSNASSEVMYTGGVNLASNAKNGTWNWGDSSNPADRAIGGLTTTVSNGTRCVNVMTCLVNGADAPISRLAISYDIEKYRKGANAAGFAVQLYTSTDGTTWTPAGDNFYTLFPADDATAGAEIVPISTTSVAGKSLLTDLIAGGRIYLAWNISVASGTTPDKAPGLALDNISIEATFSDGAGDATNLYIEDLTGWEKLMLCAADGSLGKFPGVESTGSRSVNGVGYKAFELPALPATISANNGVYYSLPAVDITAPGDYYFCATTSGLTSIADPTAYTGYVDPSVPAFVASGIYLRGEVNSWGANADWQFSDEGNGSYALYNKTLSGSFKIADASWSAACNYGSSGTSPVPGTPYALTKGTDDNISLAGLTINAREIRLTITDEGASLLISTVDDSTGLTKVYVIGDFNKWNYMDASGVLTYEDGLFKGVISMPKGSGSNLSSWVICQSLGMGGIWGLEADATTSATAGTLVKGQRGHAAVRPGSYEIAFDIAIGEYTLTEQAATATGITVAPAKALLVPGVPEEVKIFSLNNSLIEYNDQPSMFLDLAHAMGKENVSWTRHTNLGKSLDYHWDEGEGLCSDGLPGAKMMIRSEAWTHIILQEQSTRPNTNTEAFYASVRKWVEYIRENCPNPNAVIILPLNWVKSDDIATPAVYKAGNDNNAEIYTRIADELGVVVCPVSQAYNIALDDNGSATKRLIYSVNDDNTDDNVHPTPVSTYLAACMEYSLIYGEPVSSITWVPTTSVWRDPANGVTRDVDAAACAKMRIYGQQAMDSYKNKISHIDGTVSVNVEVEFDNGLSAAPTEAVTYTVTGGGSVSSEGVFTSDGTLGTFTVTAACGDFTASTDITVAQPVDEKVTLPVITIDGTTLSVSENFDSIGDAAEATLPEGWFIERNIVAPRTVGNVFTDASDKTMYAGGVKLPSNAKNGTWNFGTDASTDRALGGISTGVAGGTRGTNVIAHIVNGGTKNITNVTVTYDVEKYRKGNNSEGFNVQLYYSYNGKTWTSAGADFLTHFDADNATEGYDVVPGETRTVSGNFPIDLQPGVDIYLAWNISVASGTNCAGAMALAIDNVLIEGELPSIPAAAHYIYVEDMTGWATLGLYAWGDSELFGTWPGQASVGEVTISDKEFKVFTLDKDDSSNYNLIFNNWNNGSQAPDFAITANRNYYLRVEPTSVTEIMTSSEDSVIDVPAPLSINLTSTSVIAPGATDITVYTLAGSTVVRSAADRADISSLAPGVYVVAASNATDRTVCKFVKQ